MTAASDVENLITTIRPHQASAAIAPRETGMSIPPSTTIRLNSGSSWMNDDGLTLHAIVGAKATSGIPWTLAAAPRVVNYAGEIYIGLFGIYTDGNSVIGLVDQAGFSYIDEMICAGRSPQVFVSPRNWAIF